MPIPRDGAGDGHVCFKVTIPDTREWRRTLKSTIGLMTRGRFWMTDEREGSIKWAQQIGLEILDSLAECDCMSIDCDICAEFTSINERLDTITTALQELNDMNITVSPIMTQTCGCCGEGGTTPPTDDPTDTPLDSPPDPSDDPASIDNSSLEYRCLATGKAVNNLHDWWVNAKNNASNISAFVGLMSGIASVLPALKAYVIPITAIGGFVASLSSFLPLDEIADAIDSRKQAMICVLYEAGTPQQGKEGLINYLWYELVNTQSMSVDTWAGLRLSLDLIDYDGIYTLGAIDVSNTIIVGNCESCNDPVGVVPPPPDPDPNEELPLSYSAIEEIGYCLIPPNNVERFAGDDGVIFDRLDNDSFGVTGGSNALVRVEIGRPNLNILGIIFSTESTTNGGETNYSIMNNTLYDGNGFMGTSNLNSQTPKVVAYTDSDFLDLTGVADVASGGFISGENTEANQAWFRLNQSGNLIVKSIRWVYECDDTTACRIFYLITDSGYNTFPADCWNISGAGQTLAINDNTFSDGSPLDDIPDFITSGVAVNDDQMVFNNWQPSAPSVIRFSAYRRPDVQGSNDTVIVRLQEVGGSTVLYEYELAMPAEYTRYDFTSPQIPVGSYDVHFIGRTNTTEMLPSGLVFFDVFSE